MSPASYRAAPPRVGKPNPTRRQHQHLIVSPTPTPHPTPRTPHPAPRTPQLPPPWTDVPTPARHDRALPPQRPHGHPPHAVAHAAPAAPLRAVGPCRARRGPLAHHTNQTSPTPPPLQPPPPDPQHEKAPPGRPGRGFHNCALGRIRTCNLLIRSQMLYPLSYERLAFRRFFLPVGVAGTTLHDLRRQAKSIGRSAADLQKRPCRGVFGGTRARGRSR